MIYESLMQLPLLTKVIALGFVTCVIIAVIEISYKVEELGDAEE